MVEETKKNVSKRKLFEVGNPGGPGRPKKTMEQRIVEKEVKGWLKEYENELLEHLPELSPKLVESAKKGNMQAFDQIHKIIGAYKREGPITAIQINFRDEDL